MNNTKNTTTNNTNTTTTNNNNNINSNANNNPRSSKHRKRNIIWFNPPFSKNVATKIGRQALSSRPQIPQNFHQRQYKS